MASTTGIRAHARLAALAGAAWLAFAATAAQAEESLRPFKNWFVSGDYVAAGVALGSRGVGGFATGHIDLAGKVPADAEVVAAYLYWTAVAPNDASPLSVVQGARFKKNDISRSAVLVDRRQNVAAQCGGDWRYAPSRSTYVFRADVLRFIPRIRPDTPGAPVVTRAAETHEVSLPDGGGDTTRVTTLGAGLVVVYRRAGYAAPDFTQPVEPLRSIVIYDGAGTMNSERTRVAASLKGFYEASRENPNARLSLFVAMGRTGSGETVRLQSTVDGSALGTLARDPFRGREGNDPRASYDVANFERNEVPLAPGAMQARVIIDAGPADPHFECATWSTAVLSTEVQDTDLDGLLDVWESREQWEQKPAALRDVYLQPGDPAMLATRLAQSWPLPVLDRIREGTAVPPARLPNLQAMGANPTVQDLFVQVDYMRDGDGSRAHPPSAQALHWVARTFRDAPARPSLQSRRVCPPGAARCDVAPSSLCPDGVCPINVKFDVAGLYTPETHCNADEYCPFVSATHGGIGGNGVEEPICVDRPGRPCAAWEGAVGWKSAFRAIRDARVDANGSVCTTPLQPGCQRRFPLARKDVFRYALYARALAIPSPADASRPRASSGIADTNGGDLMVTLGLWERGTGSTFIEAATLKHELGHTLGLRHGGLVVATNAMGQAVGTTIGLNCRPNYQSVMNYLFQVGGLRDPSGTPQIAYSDQTLDPLVEGSLDERTGLVSTTWDSAQQRAQTPARWLPRWYAPLDTSFLDAALGTTRAERRCDGTRLTAAELDGEPPYVRVDSPSGTDAFALDWDADGTPNEPSAAVDISFDGKLSPLGAGANDVATMDLRQVGGRRSIGSESISRSVVNPYVASAADARTGQAIAATEPAIGGGFSLGSQPADYLGYADLGYADLGYADLGYADLGYDLGYADLGYADLGYADLGYADLGYADLGYADLGYADLGYADLGYADLGYGDLGVPAPEPLPASLATTDAYEPPLGRGAIDFTTAVRLFNSPPVVRSSVLAGLVTVEWDEAVLGTVIEYRLYRVAGGGVTPSNVAGLQPVVVLRGPNPLTFAQNAPGIGTWTYFVVAVAQDPENPAGAPLISGASNFTTEVVTEAVSSCGVQLDELVRRDGIALVPFPGNDPGVRGTGLRLISAGNLVDRRNNPQFSVWRIRNTGPQATLTLSTSLGVAWSGVLATGQDAYVRSPYLRTAHTLRRAAETIDTKDASPSRFAVSRPVACRKKR